MKPGKTIGVDVRSLMQPCGGVGEYTRELLTHLFSSDTDNRYILFYNSAEPLDHVLPAFTNPRVEYRAFTLPNKFFNARIALTGRPYIDELIGGVDAFFTPNLNFLALSPNVKKILTVHDLSFALLPEYYSWKRRIWHSAVQPKKLIQSQNHIIAVSEHTKHDLMRFYGISEEHISVIYSGINTAYKPYTDSLKYEGIRKKYRLPDKFILYLGTIEPRKNIESIVESFNQLRSQGMHDDVHLVIAGAQGWCYESVLHLIKQSPYAHDIQVTGYIPHADKAYLYALATLFVFPSYYEGFGFPPLEAQACGTPVIASAHSSLAEVLGESALLINPSLVQEITLAMKLLLDNPGLYEEYKNRGLENSNKFSWEEAAQKTRALFI